MIQEAVMKTQISNDILTVSTSAYNGELTSIKTGDGVEYLWQGDPAYWSGQAPILFPICGAIRDGRTRINGAWYQMPKHGIARKIDYEPAGQTGDSVSYLLRADEVSKKQYPFDFELLVTYRLEQNKIHHLFTVRNRGTEEMPFSLGGHPGFCCPLLPGEKFEDYQVEFEQEENTCVLPLDAASGLPDTGRPVPFLKDEKIWKLQHSDLLHDALIFPSLKSRAVTLRHPDTGRGVRISFPDMPYLLIWCPKEGAPFLALEPWSGMPTCTDEGDDFAAKRGMRCLKPGEEARLSFTVEIL